MTQCKFSFFKFIIVSTLSIFIFGCGEPESTGPTMDDIPLYPNVEVGQSMEQSVPGGFMGGGLRQYSTPDSYDDVIAFYTDTLNQYDTEVINHTSELGQQTAISIRQPDGMITVAIQEFVEEQIVNITYMEVRH